MSMKKIVKPVSEKAFEAHLILQYGCVQKKPTDLDIYAAAYPSREVAEKNFERIFGIEYAEYERLFDIVHNAPLGKRLPLNDEDRIVVREHVRMFWDEPEEAGKVPASKMVSITSLNSRVRMITGKGAL
jgi:hypothetical protein